MLTRIFSNIYRLQIQSFT